MQTILCVDDEVGVKEYLDLIKPPGCAIIMVRNEREFNRITGSQELDLVLMDIEYAYHRGMCMLSDIINRVHPVPVVVHSRMAQVETVVGCFKRGTQDYLIKPMTAGQFRTLMNQVAHYRSPGRKYQNKEDLVLGVNRVRDQYRLLANQFRDPGDFCFLSGEQGTGLAAIAKSLHDYHLGDLSGRSKGIRDRFTTYSPQGRGFGMQQCDLFGDPSRKDASGILSDSDGGTVLIQNIECLAPALQNDLAGILDSGCLKGRMLKSRVINASRFRLEGLLSTGKLLPDLGNLMVRVQLHLPALRERRSELASLVWHFLENIRESDPKVKVNRLGAGVMERLAEYDWPGNLRDLRQCLEDACLRSKTEVLDHSSLRFPPVISESENHEQ